MRLARAHPWQGISTISRGSFGPNRSGKTHPDTQRVCRHPELDHRDGRFPFRSRSGAKRPYERDLPECQDSGFYG